MRDQCDEADLDVSVLCCTGDGSGSTMSSKAGRINFLQAWSGARSLPVLVLIGSFASSPDMDGDRLCREAF